MLKCRDIPQRADAYLDRELGLRARLAVAFHLLMCGHCRAFVRQMWLAMQVYKSMSPGEAGDEEVSAIIDAVKKS